MLDKETEAYLRGRDKRELVSLISSLLETGLQDARRSDKFERAAIRANAWLAVSALVNIAAGALIVAAILTPHQ